MELILISLFLISLFSFVLIMTLNYSIFLWEKQIVENLTKNITPNNSNSSYSSLSKKTFSTIEQNSHNKTNMKIPDAVKENFEKTLVLVKQQDYKSWYQKTIITAKKISHDVEFYFSKFIKKIVAAKKPKKIPTEIVEDNSDLAVSKTIDKINEINRPEITNQIIEIQHSEDFTKTKSGFPMPVESKPTVATLNMVNDDQLQSQKDEVYEKIESNILQRLKNTGLSHYDIWLELGKHYEKYSEREKAIEIYSMVMKHAEGRNKEMARDGLIALS
jgi:hypothetical protein